MIPYDDLVVALTAWRARQGLPVGRSTAPAAPVASAASPPPPVLTNPAPAAPARSAPPRPAPAAHRAAPAPQAPPAHNDFEDSALIEDASEDADDEYVMQLGEEPGESTAIGPAPEPSPAKRGKRW